MPDYGEILGFLATNPPRQDGERELHASLLELLAKCLRSEQFAVDDENDEELEPGEIRWINVN
ncbi:MAG: hypothetical protein ACTSYK_04750 [Alphaproteobacteria bacterium]